MNNILIFSKTVFKNVLTLSFSLLFSVALIAQDTYIKGRVSDDSGPLSGVNVNLSGRTSSSLYTKSDGSFTFKVVPGKYTVTIKELGYKEVSKTVSVEEGKTEVINVNLSFGLGKVTSSATLIEQSTFDAPASIYVISEEDIKERGYQNILELLEDIPEVEIQRKSNPEFHDNIGFRGITGNEKFIIFMDGIRITSAVGDPHTIYTNYPIEHAKSVEVLVGPASSVYGADAFAGVINITTKNAEDLDGFVVSGSYGNFGTINPSLHVGKKMGDVELTLYGNYYTSNNADLSSIYTDDYEWFNDNYAVDGSVRASLFNQDTRTVGFDNRDFFIGNSSYFVNGNLRIKDFEIGYIRNNEMHSSSTSLLPEYNVYNKEAQYGFNISSLYMKHLFTTDNENLKLQTIITNNKANVNNESAFVNVYNDYNVGYRYQFSKSIKFQERMTLKVNDAINVVAGVSLEDITSLPRTSDLLTPYDVNLSSDEQELVYIGTDITDTEGNNLAIEQDFHFLNFQNYGGFVQGQISPIEEIQITIGSRFDYNTRFGQSINPRLGLLFKPMEALRIKFLYGESFLSPSPWKSYQHYGSFVPTENNDGEVIGLFAAFLHLPNPDLQPEKLRTLEGNVSYILNDNLVINANGFYNRVTNFIDYFVQDQTRDFFKGVPVAYIETPQNLGEITSFGGTFRVEGTTELLSLKLKFFGAYTYMDGNLSNGVLPFVSKHTFKGGLTLRGDQFSITPRVMYRDRSFSLKNNGETNFSNDAFVMVNISGRYQLLDNESLRVAFYGRVNNLLNSKIYHIANTGFEGFTLSPQDPLRFNVGLEVGF